MRRLSTQPKIGKGCLGEDRDGKENRGLNNDHTKNVWKDVLKRYPNSTLASGSRSEHKFTCPDGICRSPRHPGEYRYVIYTDG